MKFRLGSPLLLAVFFIIVLVADQIRCDDEPAAESVKPIKRKSKKSKTKKALATKNLKKVRPDRPQADRPQAQAPEYDSAYDYGDNYDYGTDPDYDAENGKCVCVCVECVIKIICCIA